MLNGQKKLKPRNTLFAVMRATKRSVVMGKKHKALRRAEHQNLLREVMDAQ